MSGASTISWSGGPVPFRRRADLVTRPSFAAPTKAWLVKDPVALRYFELREEEHFLWQLLDGRRTWQEVRECYDRTFAPEQLNTERLAKLLERLHEQGLVSSERSGQGVVLHRRGRRTRRQSILRRFTNPLAIQLPGIDPAPLLARLAPLVAPLFTTAFAATCIVICCAAVLTAITHFDALERELRTAIHLPSLVELPYWIGAVAFAKIIHELAHAITCRRYGGECRELGLLVLCGAPALYCDVTSMWMTPERWKRVAVGAAGMIAEIVLAACALLLWRFTHPGTMHDLALYVAVVCSVATVAVNANPLLRYDGYFIVADWVGIVNLGEQATAALKTVVTVWLFGEDAESDRSTSTVYRNRLALYAVASAIYRWTITFAVLWWIRNFLEPHGLAIFADLLTIVMVGTLLVGPVRGAAEIAKAGKARRLETWRRPVVRLLGVVLFLVALLSWPFSYDVAAPAVVRLKNAEYVYVVVGGTLVDSVAPSAQVQPGDVLAKLADSQIELEAERSKSEVGRRRLEIETLERRRVTDPSVGETLPQAVEQLAATEKQWRHLAGEQERLTIRAGRAGTVLPLFSKTADPSTAVEPLAFPLDAQRRGAYLPSGTPLCAVGDPTMLTVELFIEQGDVEFVRIGQAVRLRFDAAPDQVIAGRITETAEVALANVPEELRDRLPGGNDADATSPRRRTWYVARVELTGEVARLPIGSVGDARIEASPQSIAKRLRRWINATIRFE